VLPLIKYKRCNNINIIIYYKYNMSFFVYLLLSTDYSTYVGATVDLDHRLRQHNKELSGGAHYTSGKVEQGHLWIRVAHVEGFPDWQSALQFEWRWKQLTRKQTKGYPLNKRMQALKELIKLDKPTTKAKLYSEWPSGGPKVVIEDQDTQKIWDKLLE